MVVVFWSRDLGASSVQVGIDPGGEDKLSNTFLIVTHPDGSVVEYGLVPREPFPEKFLDYFNWPGRIDETGTGDIPPHEAEYYSNRYPLSDIEYQNLMDSINADKAYLNLRYSLGPFYGLKNCSRWSIIRLIDIGVFLGALTFPGDPYLKQESLLLHLFIMIFHK